MTSAHVVLTVRIWFARVSFEHLILADLRLNQLVRRLGANARGCRTMSGTFDCSPRANSEDSSFSSRRPSWEESAVRARRSAREWPSMSCRNGRRKEMMGNQLSGQCEMCSGSVARGLYVAGRGPHGECCRLVRRNANR